MPTGMGNQEASESFFVQDVDRSGICCQGRYPNLFKIPICGLPATKYISGDGYCDEHYRLQIEAIKILNGETTCKIS